MRKLKENKGNDNIHQFLCVTQKKLGAYAKVLSNDTHTTNNKKQNNRN